MWNLRLDRLPLQQSLVEQFVELLFILLSINHPLSQVPQPKSSTRVRKRWIHHLKWHKVTHDNGAPKHSTSVSIRATVIQACCLSGKLCRHKKHTLYYTISIFLQSLVEQRGRLINGCGCADVCLCVYLLPWYPALLVLQAWCRRC